MTLVSSSLSTETFEVRSAQSFYQVFNNEDVTLEWTFTNSSLDSLQMYCDVIMDNKHSVLLEYVKGLELPQSGLFKGRVQLDKDVLRERRIRLHVSSLRTEDSGRYSCEVYTREGSDWAQCGVTVKGKLFELRG